jgi:hypothetical protein
VSAAVAVPSRNVTHSPRELHMEVMDSRTFDVWLHQLPVTLEEYKAFKPEPPYVKSGLACSAMDFAWFLRSPGASADGELEARTIGGREFVRVARPLRFRGLPAGDAPTRVEIDKHHLLGFKAGSTLRVAQLADGSCYVQQTVGREDRAVAPPPGWTISPLILAADWSLLLPTPVAVWFFHNFDSYIGPVERTGLP